ncbi:MAG: metallopeptidase family protein [Tepidisphaeraceae bacterium]|jgi:predicted Zn-dependent protease with MMP-like domain
MYSVTRERFGELIEEVLAELPEQFAKFVEEIPIEVADRPSPKQLRDAHVPRGHTLLGLYHGRNRLSRSVADTGALPDVIYLFQQPIQSMCDNDEDLRRQVRITLLHEIGHHFGMDEDDLEKLGYR